jgi:hypothetical protein
LEYFQFDSIRAIARVLADLDGTFLSQDPDPLRVPLTEGTGLRFLPPRYTVWRNYARVLELQLVAVNVDGLLRCTEICRLLANEESGFGVDEYMGLIARRFYYPSPVFEGYARVQERVFPFCAILKYLLAQASQSRPYVELNELFSRVLGNNCTGTEPAVRYVGLPETRRRPHGDELRQVREMLRFFSQCSFLKWNSPALILDTYTMTEELLKRVERFATPDVTVQNGDRALELLHLSRIAGREAKLPTIETRLEAADREFTEGQKVRVLHLRTERSRVLRELFFSTVRRPHRCDMCDLNVTTQYPWVERLLEVHHVLPLGSPVHVEGGRTSLDDLVGVCPTCHRATHAYYRDWLHSSGIADFRSKAEAHAVYNEAKRSLVMQ